MVPLAPTQVFPYAQQPSTSSSVAIMDFSIKKEPSDEDFSIKQEPSNEKLVVKPSDLESNTELSGIDEATRKRILRRVDLQILPIAMCMNVFSFLDRGVPNESSTRLAIADNPQYLLGMLD